MKNCYDVIVIGGGPAGLSAAVYASRAGVSVAVIEKSACGGQMLLTDKIENYPSYIGASGYELGEKMLSHAQSLGAEIIYAQALSIDCTGGRVSVSLSDGRVLNCLSVIYACGVSPKKLNVLREAELTGQGVSYCATCDGTFFKNKPIAVYGGASAVSSAKYLSGLSPFVTLITHVKGLKAPDGVRLICGEITELIGTPLSAIKVKSGDNTEELEVNALFVSNGNTAETKLVLPFADTDEKGYIIGDEKMQTRSPWLFVAGDARSKNLRQVVTAAADGAIAGNGAAGYARKIKKQFEKQA